LSLSSLLDRHVTSKVCAEDLSLGISVSSFGSLSSMDLDS